MDWFRAGTSLAVGLGGKTVKIFDSRFPKPAVSTSVTRDLRTQ